MKILKNPSKSDQNDPRGSDHKDRLKPGPMSPNKKLLVNKTLEKLFFADEVTASKAATIAGCSYEYALAKFTQIADKIISLDKATYIEKIDIARMRALEGLSRKIYASQSYVKKAEDQLEKTVKIQDALYLGIMDHVKDSPIGQKILTIIDSLDEKTFLLIVSALGKQLDKYKDYGFLAVQNIAQIRHERIHVNELLMQFSSLEMQPPINDLLEYEIEKKLTNKINKFRADYSHMNDKNYE